MPAGADRARVTWHRRNRLHRGFRAERSRLYHGVQTVALVERSCAVALRAAPGGFRMGSADRVSRHLSRIGGWRGLYTPSAAPAAAVDL